MDTNGYIERAIVQTLGVYERETDEYRSAERQTGSLATAVNKVSDSGAAGSSVRRALGRLQEKGLIEEVVPERMDGPKRQNYWSLTEDGLDECRRLEEAYEREEAKLRKRFGREHHSSVL